MIGKPAVPATGQNSVDDCLNPMGVVWGKIQRNVFMTDGHGDLLPCADHRLAFAVGFFQHINGTPVQSDEK